MNLAFGSLRRWAVLLTPCLLLAVACSSPSQPTGTVRGTVTLGDAPYDKAAVMLFSPTTGPVGIADLQPGGTFAMIDPIPVGTYTVYLAPKSVDSGDGSAQPMAVTIDESVPDKYWNEASSDVSIEVKEGPNEVTVKLVK